MAIEETGISAASGGYEHLARRAHLYLEQHGGRAREEVLAQQVFGVRGKPEIWGGILAHVLSDQARFRRLASGEWCLAHYSEANHPLADLEYIVIDTETTGLHPQRNRVIEIAAVKLRGGQRVATFQSLINPHRRIPGFITKFTGISNEMTSSAPGFSQIADKLLDFLGQAILVGHNIPFDIRFLDYEFRRLGRPALLNETVDTITLAVRLHPGLRRPNLDRLAALLNLPVQNRHRAFGDASLTAEAFMLLLDKAERQGYKTLADLRAGRPRLTTPPVLALPEDSAEEASASATAPTPTLFQMDLRLETAQTVQVARAEIPEIESEVNAVIERPERIKMSRGWPRDPTASLTNRATAHARDVLSRKHLEGLPSRPGVYIMKDHSGEVIYVGKAKNLRDRVSSYYSEPLGYTRKLDGLAESIDRIDHIVTGSELEALLLESKLIKKYRPRYNSQLRNYETYPFIKIDLSQRYPRVYSVREIADDGARYFGPFKNRRAVDATIDVIERLFPVRTCTRSFEPPEPGKRKRKQAPPCLRLSLQRCPGPCAGNDSVEDHAEYMKIVEEVISFLSGERENMLDTLWDRLNRAVQHRNFEKAAELRDAVAQVEKIVASQQFLAAAVEGNNTLICLPSAQEGAVEVLCIYQGRLGRQLRLLLTVPSEETAATLATTWQELAAEESRLAGEQPAWGKRGGRVIGQEAVDEINIISRWLYAHHGHPAIVQIPAELPEISFWQEAARDLATRSLDAS
ncbi:MAG TPA: exonuclease domain-containing protein [Chloroflexia bacterium]|nr:exonuclease domain-containing protein [Chloroflexia bacterium]